LLRPGLLGFYFKTESGSVEVVRFHGAKGDSLGFDSVRDVLALSETYSLRFLEAGDRMGAPSGPKH